MKLDVRRYSVKYIRIVEEPMVKRCVSLHDIERPWNIGCIYVLLSFSRSMFFQCTCDISPVLIRYTFSSLRSGYLYIPRSNATSHPFQRNLYLLLFMYTYYTCIRLGQRGGVYRLKISNAQGGKNTHFLRLSN